MGAVIRLLDLVRVGAVGRADDDGLNIVDELIPVSYTHLDVYKRQALPEGTRFQVMAPVVRGRKGEHQKEFEAASRSGFARVRVDGILYDLTEKITLEKNKKHNIEIVVDRLVIGDDVASRLADSIETATALTGGTVLINVIDGEDMLFSQSYACPEHGISIEELAPRMFSFNNPFGACPKCTGLGTFLKVDPELVIPNPNLTIKELSLIHI